MHATVNGEDRPVVEVRPRVRPLILRRSRRDAQNDEPEKGGAYCATVSPNLGHFAGLQLILLRLEFELPFNVVHPRADVVSNRFEQRFDSIK
jgi:hypothetical protein